MSEVRTWELADVADAASALLSAAGWWRYAELGTDLASQSEVDLAVTRYHRTSATGSCPARVVRALVDLPAALSAQVTLEITALSSRDRQMKLLALALIVVTRRLRREHQP